MHGRPSDTQLAPEYESLELGIGESLLMKAIGESCGRTLAQVKAEYKKIGDLGEVAFNSRTRQKTLFKSKPLTVRGVFDELKKVAKTSGKDVRRSVLFLLLLGDLARLVRDESLIRA